MLVLSRKLNEKITIGDDVTITVIKLRNNQIRLGIEAPRDVKVLRGELESANTAKPSKSKTSGESRRSAPSADSAELPLRVIDGMQSADEVSRESASESSSTPSSENVTPSRSQPLSVFMGKMKVDASRSVIEPLPANELMTAT